MKKFAYVALAMTSVLALASCTSKVEFSAFKEKADAAYKLDYDYNTAVVKGKVISSSDSNKSTSDINVTLSVKSGHLLAATSLTDTNGLTYATLLNAMQLSTFTATEISSYTYYAGDNFKVTESNKGDDGSTSETTIEWNKYGFVTSFKGKGSDSSSKASYELSVSYSKK